MSLVANALSLRKGRSWRSWKGIFFGYASHSRAYLVLNLETNQIMETCEVTFDETHPCCQLVFECAGDDELGEEIFQEEHEHGDDEDGGVVLAAEHVLSYGPPWAHCLGGYQDRLLGGPLGLLDLRCTAPVGVKHKDYGGEVLG
jgi:hypothetical protein